MEEKNKLFYKEKIYSEILKPMLDYYNVNYDDEIVKSFCRVLSFYDYRIVSIVRDELLMEYKTFPKLPNWIEKCKEKSINERNSIVLCKELKEQINKLRIDKDWLYVKEQFKKTFSEATFNSWFIDVLLIIKTENFILMSTESEFKIDYINKNFMDGLKRKNHNGETYYTKKGIKQFWKETNCNINKIELRPIQEVNNLFIQNSKPNTSQQNNNNDGELGND